MRRALAVVVVALTFPAVAAAHATLAFVSPATQSRLDKPPTAVVMRFDQTVTITPRAIEVFTAGGRKVSGPAVSTSGGRGVRAPLTGLKQGEAYTVRWRATSADGHTGIGRLHVRHRRHAAAPDRGLRLDGAGVGGRRSAVGVLRLARLAARHDRIPAPHPARAASRSDSRTGSTGSPRPAGSRCSTSASPRS